MPWENEPGPILAEIEEFVTGTHTAVTRDRFLTTILFLDVVGSTVRAAQLGDSAWLDLLASYYDIARKELARFSGREIDAAGDGFLASFDGPARAIHSATAIVDAVKKLGIEIRAGLHTGECEVVNNKLGGLAVHIGARVISKAEPGEVVVSSTVKDLVAGSGIKFEDKGWHMLKGVPGRWRLYAVVP
jgi:class 3 adenylate cyclase